jgi:hypothetical protein
MQTLLQLGAIASVLAATGLAAFAGPPNRPAGELRREGDLKAGDRAPDFTVQDLHGKQSVKLSELRGKPVVLIFGSCT